MKIKLTSVFVDDQERALKFYTQVMGFVKKLDFPMGKFKWLAVVSPEEPDGTQLLLEPNDNPAAKTHQESVFKQGIRAATFFVEDVQKEVKFSSQSCYVTEDEELAKKFLEVVQKFNGKGHLYKAVKLQ